MYIPSAFRESDQGKLFDFIEGHSFGLLISNLQGELFATHLPLLLKRDGAAKGQLVGHLARENPQWRELAGQEVLAVFTGPHAYISPSWYESDHVVPTWNYVAVHVYGRCDIVDDVEAMARIVEDYVSTYERTMPTPWTIDPSTPFFKKMVKMVVGFRVEISRIEGKWKLNQNHPAERREKVARQLSQDEHFHSRAIARLMADALK
jgi:transcriptional regulator